MTSLILLNGTPGIGKSTLARRFVTDHPLALNLDIDTVRGLLGQWTAQDDSKQLARDLAVTMAATHLANGHDVIVPQLVGRLSFIEILRDTATVAGAMFHHIILSDDTSNSVARLRARRAELTASGPAHPMLRLEPAHDDETISSTFDNLLSIAGQVPGTCVVDTQAGDVDGAYAAILCALAPD